MGLLFGLWSGAYALTTSGTKPTTGTVTDPAALQPIKSTTSKVDYGPNGTCTITDYSVNPKKIYSGVIKTCGAGSIANPYISCCFTYENHHYYTNS